MKPDVGNPRASIVIPAHNEEAVLLRCLTGLLTDSREGEWEVVVVANGCTDDTARVARSTHWPVVCIELPAGGKIAALNAADEACATFPRIYCDADVVLDAASVRDLLDTLDRSSPVAAAPTMTLDVSGVSWWLRAYYRVWRQLPVFGPGYVGSGVYAVNAAGHARIAPFPEVVNDDEHVRRAFAPGERLTSPGEFVVRPARRLSALLARAARTRRGSRQLTSPGDHEPTGTGAALRRLAHRPASWPDLVVFLVTTGLVRGAARWATADSWGRDSTSREGARA